MHSHFTIESLAPSSDGSCIIFTKKAPSTLACTVRRQTPKGAVLEFASTFAIPSRFMLETGASRTRHTCIEVNRSRTAIEVEFIPSASVSSVKLSRDTVLRTLRSRRLSAR